ncbi:MAG: carbohydrate-binding domain-containing protein, partial [Candidatus Methanoplasma sp.]|nr:carbohydrate-binding domain-containing protein [Candidatus Methanoplasma sp.]
ITINGGTVTASSSGDAAGIGGSTASNAGTITIAGGTVIANSNDEGAGIGNGGMWSIGGTITINGGNITATGGNSGAGIGSGGHSSVIESILIYGEDTTVTAKCRNLSGAEDIGGGASGGMATDVFVALTRGNLIGTGDAEIGSHVDFTADPSSEGTVTVLLSAPLDAAGTIDLLTGLGTGTGAKTVSFITNVTTAVFALQNYDNSPIERTGAELMTSGGSVDFQTASHTVTLTSGNGVTGFTYRIDGGSSVSYSGTFPISSGASLEVTAVTETGYSFSGWSGSVSSQNNPLTVSGVSADLDLTASAVLQSPLGYRVTFSSGDEYTVYVGGLPVTSPINVVSGDSLYFSIVVSDGYVATPTMAGIAEFTPRADGTYSIRGILSNIHVNITVRVYESVMEDVPGGNGGATVGAVDMPGEWAVLNLICAAIAIFAGILAVVSRIHRTGNGERNPRSGTSALLSIVSLAVGIISVIVFLLTEDIGMSAVAYDGWTIPMFVLLFVSVAAALTSSRLNKGPGTE